MGLELRTVGEYSVLQVSDWTEEGLAHGFIGKPANFCSRTLPEEAVHFCRDFGVQCLNLLDQEHGHNIVETDRCQVAAPKSGAYLKIAQADGWMVDLRVSRQSGGKLAFGIRSADCLPIIIRTPERLVLVHAGWRGLAAGIIEEALEALRDEPGLLEVAIGPAAGADRYEVGKEVIEALGTRAIYRHQPNGKYLLSLADSAVNVFSKSRKCKFFLSGRCTLSRPDYHSYRRDGAQKCGQNLAFAIF